MRLKLERDREPSRTDGLDVAAARGCGSRWPPASCCSRALGQGSACRRFTRSSSSRSQTCYGRGRAAAQGIAADADAPSASPRGYRANVWNIGAEGQLTLGAICGGGVGARLSTAADSAWLLLPDARRRRASAAWRGRRSRRGLARGSTPTKS